MSSIRQTTKTATTTPVLLTDIDGEFNSYDGGKVSFAFYNNGSVTFYIGDSNVTISTGLPVAAGSAVTLDAPLGADLYAVVESGSTEVRVLQIG